MAIGTPSLAARCTTCQTVFRVVPDQLRVSAGWVRCGRCTAVFNAADNLVELEDGVVRRSVRLPVPVPVPDAMALPAPVPAPLAKPTSPAPPKPLTPPAPWAPRAATRKPAAPTPDVVATSDGAVVTDWSETLPYEDDLRAPLPMPVPLPVPVPPRARPSVAEPEHEDHDDRFNEIMRAAEAAEQAEEAEAAEAAQAADRSKPAAAQAPALSAKAPAKTPAKAPAKALADTPASETLAPVENLPALPFNADTEADTGIDVADPTNQPAPSFIRQADRAERWRQPPVAWALAAVSLLLIGTLAMQVLLEYRDLAASRWPVLRPMLVATCNAVGCKVDAARAIDGLAVESSGLVRIERSDRYRLAVTLRNRAGIDLAVPALDLSLTDTQGRLLARRVLQLAELGAPQATVASGRELSLQATLRAAPGNAGESVAGYTIELFYP